LTCLAFWFRREVAVCCFKVSTSPSLQPFFNVSALRGLGSKIALFCPRGAVAFHSLARQGERIQQANIKTKWTTDMAEQYLPVAETVAAKRPASGRSYRFSPKVAIIAGLPCAGKSHTAQRLVEEFGYLLLNLDRINSIVAKKFGGDIDAVRDPGTYGEFKPEFSSFLRKNRYRDIVFEGCRISHQHIYQAFVDVLCDLYSPFTIVQPFYLNPPTDVRMKQYTLRKVLYSKRKIKKGDPGVSEAELVKPFSYDPEPILDGFLVTANSNRIIQWARDNADQAHPGVSPENREIFKAIAEAESFNPFYQTIEHQGRILVPGFTESPKAWANILRLGVNFQGKTLCDYGCMHGYYSFKAEEQGALSVGVDMDQGAIALANYLAGRKNSQCHFMLYDITTPLRQRYDIIMALNVLHRTTNFEQATGIMFRHCNECILEVGESQLPFIIAEGTRQGFKLMRNIPSHRQQSCIGPRRVLHMVHIPRG